MRKAKIILTAAGILAAVGGAFAIKSNIRTGNLKCSLTANSGSNCPIFARVAPVVGAPQEYLYCTLNTATNCTKGTLVYRIQ